jgi:hypothetical protein
MQIKNAYEDTVIKAIDDKSEELRSISLKVRYNVNLEWYNDHYLKNSYYITLDPRKTGIRSVLSQIILK